MSKKQQTNETLTESKAMNNTYEIIYATPKIKKSYKILFSTEVKAEVYARYLASMNYKVLLRTVYN